MLISVQELLNASYDQTAAILRVSARSDDAGLMRVSAIGVSVTTSPLSADSSSISAKQGDASNLRISSFSNDAALNRVSAIGGTSSPLSADSSSVSAKQGDASNLRMSAFSDNAALMRVSAIGGTSSPLSADSSSVSAKQGDAANLMVSAKSGDAALFRVSAVGGTAGDNTIVDGTTQTISATLTPISASPAGTVAGLVTNAFQYDANKHRVSAFVDSGSVSSKSGDANQLHVSSVQGDAGLLHVSAILDNGSVSAKSADANQFHVSSVQGDAALLRVSAIGGTAGDNTIVDGTTQTISATLTPISANPATTIQGLVTHTNQPDAARLRVSAIQGDAGIQRTSAFIDSGSVSAKQSDAANLNVSAKSLAASTNLVSASQGSADQLRVSAIGADANTLHVSAVQGDAGLQHTSSYAGDANQLHVSSVQGDAALLRISAIGGTAGDNTIVDGSIQTLSASLLRVSGVVSAGFNGLVTYAQNRDDAVNLRVSALSKDGALFRVSAIGGTAGDNTIVDGSIQTLSASVLRVSGVVSAGFNGLVTYAQNRDDAVNLRVSAKSLDAGTLLVSAKQGDGALFRVSAIGADANTLHVSTVQGNAALQRTSAINQDANFMHVSAYNETDTISKGGTNLFSTSAGIAQLSAVKTTADGRIYGWALGNPAGVDQYLQIFFASATSAVTLGTTVPNLSVYIPTLGGNNISFTQGISAANGITIAATSTAGGNTAGASAVRVNLFYG